MITEALFLFLILLLGLVLYPFLGGKYNTESFTGSFNGSFNVQPENQMNNNTSSSGNSSSTSSSSNKSSTNYDNYNHYSGSSSQLTNGATFYGNNGGSVKVNMQSNGTPVLTVVLSQGQQPITFTSSPSSSSSSGSSSGSNSGSSSSSGSSASTKSSHSSPKSTVFTVTETKEGFTDFSSKSANLEFYGPKGETALVINYQGQQAIQVNTNNGSFIYTINNPSASNQSASTPFNSNYTTYNNTPSTYFGSTGVNGANINNSNKAYNNSLTQSSTQPAQQSSYPSSQLSSTTSSTYNYSNSLPQGIPRSQIPPGQEDLYILKSEIVPPVCPACPVASACPRQEKCPPCPACARCPEPSFECKKVPNYNSINNEYLPAPVLNDFSSFGM